MLTKPRLIRRSARPPDYETPTGLFDTWITPNDLFYVRSHLYTPSISLETWSLRIDGEVQNSFSAKLEDLKKFSVKTLTVTLECAGNGRSFFEPPVAGIQWQKGAVGTARWTGVRLADVLKKAEVTSAGKFVMFNGADEPIGLMPDFVRSLPMEKALHPDTLLVFEMNGEPLPLLHGFPLRLLVPGWEAAYSVKWLTHVRVLDREYDGFFVKTAYRFPKKPVAPGTLVSAADTAPLAGLPVKSILTAPADRADLPLAPTLVRGYAWAGEAEVSRVDVSTDRGATWQPAKLGADRERYAWRAFEYLWTPGGPGHYSILARATDTDGRVQPIVPSWNPSGYLWNVIERVSVNVKAS